MKMLAIIFSVTAMLMLSGQLLTFGSVQNNLSNEDDTIDYLRLSYNCSNPNPYIIRDNGRAKQIFLEFSNCISVPEGLFRYSNNIEKLVIAVSNSKDYVVTDFSGDVFPGLENLRELELRGFEDITSVDEGVLSPLRNIASIHLNGFGKNSYSLPLNALGTLLRGSADTPLERIIMNGVRTLQHGDKRLDIAGVFNIRNVTITCLIVKNSYITSLTGSFTDILPSLTTLSLSLSITFEPALYSAMDALFLPNLRFLQIYSNDEHTSTIFNLFEFSLIDLLRKVMGKDLLSIYLSIFDINCSLNVRVKITESLTTLILNRIHISNFTGQPPLIDYKPVCFHESNQLRILDLAGSQLEEDLRVISGLKLLTFLNLQTTGIRRFSPRQLAELPLLKSYLLGGNNLGECIASDYASTLFQSGENLISLDLATCNLVTIPHYEFSSLTSLKYLNLSGNMISNVDFSLTNSTQLRVLNLSKNMIEQLSVSFTKMLATRSDRNSNATWLEIDLSGNLLSCLCNATDFLNWIKSPGGVTFTNLNSYKCLYPNGSWVNLTSVDIEQLKYECMITVGVNNTDCPCNRSIQEKLYNIRYSLVELGCKLDGVFAEMKTLNWNMTINRCFHLKQMNLIIIFVVTTAVILIIMLVIIIVVGFVRYKTKKPEEIRDVLKLLSAGKLISALVALLFDNRSPDAPSVFQYDVFIFYHDSDWLLLQQEIVNKLDDADINIVTKDDILFGSNELEGVLEYIAQSRTILLILSPDFVEDDCCRDVTIRASERQHAVIPLVFIPFLLDDNEVIFNNLVNICRPIYWHFDEEQQEDILKELKARIVDDTLEQVFDVLESGLTNPG